MDAPAEEEIKTIKKEAIEVKHFRILWGSTGKPGWRGKKLPNFCMKQMIVLPCRRMAIATNTGKDKLIFTDCSNLKDVLQEILKAEEGYK